MATNLRCRSQASLNYFLIVGLSVHECKIYSGIPPPPGQVSNRRSIISGILMILCLHFLSCALYNLFFVLHNNNLLLCIVSIFYITQRTVEKIYCPREMDSKWVAVIHNDRRHCPLCARFRWTSQLFVRYWLIAAISIAW